MLSLLNEKEKGYLFGLFIGDGYLYKGKCRHYQTYFYLNPTKDKDVAEFILKILKKIGISPYIMEHHGCLVIRINSKELYNDFKEEIENIQNTKNDDFALGFVSGFIDSDGYVGTGDIVITNKNVEFLKIVKNFCDKFEVHSRIWHQDTSFNGSVFSIWRLRIGTKFKYKKHYSQKIARVYGGGDYPS